jgi:hypothetical protein
MSGENRRHESAGSLRRVSFGARCTKDPFKDTLAAGKLIDRRVGLA